MTNTGNSEQTEAPAERTVTAEELKRRLDVQSTEAHKTCDCPGTEGATVEDMLTVQQGHGGFQGNGPWTEDEAAEILTWWGSPVVSKERVYGPEDADEIVESILAQGVTPAEQRTGISDRKAAVLDGLSMVRDTLPRFAQSAAAFALIEQQHRRQPNILTEALSGAAAQELSKMETAITRAVDMLIAVVRSMD